MNAGKSRTGPSEQGNQTGTELQQGGHKPYKDIIDVRWGDAHSLGMKPISFVRQVLAACIYPELLRSDRFPIDVRRRAQRLLSVCDGESIGAYSVTSGIPYVQQSVSDFISRRDGGIPPSPNNIFICSGSQTGLRFLLKLLSNTKDLTQAGVLTPVPTYQTFTFALEVQGITMVPYNLCEEEGWALKVEELRRVLQTTEGHRPKILYIINPGNPTGHVQSRESIEEVIRFAAEEKLFLLADEVYQGRVQAEVTEFVSYKKVLSEMGPGYSDTVQLVSFHSVSKSLLGECGLRGGYIELVNFDPEVLVVVDMLFSTLSCTAIIGQFAVDLMVDPPQPGDPSYPTYSEEVRSSQETLARNIRRAQEVLGGLPGVTCQPVMGGIYVYPRLHLPPKAVEQAEAAGMEADLLYCRRLLEEAGVNVGPGFECGQREGTHHFRMCVLTPTENMEELLRRLEIFHLRFFREFS